VAEIGGGDGVERILTSGEGSSSHHHEQLFWRSVGDGNTKSRGRGGTGRPRRVEGVYVGCEG
jgi:hypothetical protein